jgi:hypothetical protein
VRLGLQRNMGGWVVVEIYVLLVAGRWANVLERKGFGGPLASQLLIR